MTEGGRPGAPIIPCEPPRAISVPSNRPILRFDVRVTELMARESWYSSFFSSSGLRKEMASIFSRLLTDRPK